MLMLRQGWSVLVVVYWAGIDEEAVVSWVKEFPAC
jgi:hypothetical protein